MTDDDAKPDAENSSDDDVRADEPEGKDADKASDAKEDAAELLSGPPRRKRIVELAAVVAGVVGLDLWTKAWAWDTLREGSTITVIENWFYFEFGFNTGAAFSFLRDGPYARMMFIGVTVLALLYMARLAATLPTRFRTAFVAVALVSGGALGNLHDRLFRVMEIRGEMRYGVVDFIKVYYWPDKVWPTFNVADVALVVGVGLLFIFLTRHGDALDAAKAAAKKADAGGSSAAKEAAAS